MSRVTCCGIVALAAVLSGFNFAEEEAASRGPVSLGVTANRGPSTNSGSLIVPVAANARCISIFTQGETVNNKADASPYRMVGCPDGMGFFDNGDGTMTVVTNHEVGNTAGAGRRHHGANGQNEGIATAPGAAGRGAFVSRWIVNHTTLAVLDGSDQDRCGQISLWDRTAQKFVKNPNAAGVAGTDITDLTLLNFNRFCSADLAATTAYRNSILAATADATKFTFATAAPAGITFGTRTRIFLAGEEGGSCRAFAHFLNGSNEGQAFELPGFGNKLAYENLLACPAEQDKTIVIAQDDTSGAGAGEPAAGYVVMWVGTKNANSTSAPTPVYQGQGSDADQAGLIKGTLYGLKVTGVVSEDRTTALGAPKGADLPFTMVALPDQSVAGADTRAALVTATATPFERPEDGAWDPVKKNVYYFVTTDRFDTVKNPEGVNRTAATTRAVTAANPAGQVGRSRLWKLTFTDISNPEQGGKITMLLDGTEQQQMMDNLGVDARGENIIICEDAGNTDYLGKVLNYNIATGALSTIAQFDPARFDPAVAAAAPVDQLLTVDEESSGVIDATSTLGTGWFLIALQIHASQSGELFERGQYVALFNPASAAPPAVNTTSSSAKLTANPSSPNVGAAATFTVTGTTTTGGQIAWELDWGDGTATTKSTVNSGAALSTTHTYTVMGSFKVTATGTDTLSGQKTVQTLTVLVKDTLRSGKLLLRVNFGSSGHDAAQLTGALPLATTATLAGPVTVDIGGFKKDFTLNEKGGGKDGKNAFQIFKKRKPDSISSIQAKFFCKLFDVDLLTSLADEGIINKDADRESKSVRCVVTFNGIPYDATITVVYIAKKDKKGFTR